jgi:hypothetical protein
MINPAYLLIALPTLITGLYLLRRMKLEVDQEAKKQHVPIPIEKSKKENQR